MLRLWVHSPHAVTNEALSRYVASLGFVAQPIGDGASAAVFDLTPLGSDLPPAPELPTLALVSSMDGTTLERLRRLGYGAVNRPEDGPERFAASIRAVVTGPWRSRRDDDDGPDDDRATAPAPELTEREAQVLRLLMLGFPNKRIASRLGISERTVKHFVSSLIRKHEVRGRAGVVVKQQQTEAGAQAYRRPIHLAKRSI